MGVWNFNLRSSQALGFFFYFSVPNSTKRWFRNFIFIFPASTQQPKILFFGRKDSGEANPPNLSLGLYIALQQMLHQCTPLGLPSFLTTST
jgi:hypothetical protein